MPIWRSLKDMKAPEWEDDISQWIDATDEERAEAVFGLLGLVSAINHFPEKEPLQVVFPPSLRNRKRT